MAQVLQRLTQAATPGSGTPGTPGGDKITRTQSKKLFRDEVDKYVQAVKLIPVYADALSKIGKTDKIPVSYTDANGQQHSVQIGRKEYKEFVSSTIKGMQKLPALAFTLNKTKRRYAANAGFLAPARFRPEIMQFFAQANLGPQVAGEFVMRTDKPMNKKAVPKSDSLRVLQGTRLNDLLYFTQQGGPLSGIISPGTLTPLFALHAYYTGMANAQKSSRLSASNEMRQILGPVIADTIRNDVTKISNDNPALAGQAQAVGQQLLNAIGNPGTQVPSEVGGVNIFNPNDFTYAHFSKLISNSKLGGELNLEAMRPQIAATYGGLPGVTEAVQAGQPPEQVVLAVQQNNAALARAWKNQVKGKADREKKKREKEAQAGLAMAR